MKKILTKNKFVFSHYPFMKKNIDEKQICFSSVFFFFYIKEYYGKPVRNDNCFLLIAFSFLLVAFCVLLFTYCFLLIAF